MGRLGVGLVSALVSLALISIFVSNVSAAPDINPWNISCINGVEYDLLCDGLCSNPGAVVINHTRICAQFGTVCNNVTNSCDMAYNVPTDFFSLMIVGLLAIAAMFLVIAIKFPDDWGVVKTLFYISSLIFIVAAVGAMGSFFLANQTGLAQIVNSVYLACIFVLFIFVAYIILRWILAFAIRWLKDIEAKKRRV
jgi:nitrate/nitrite transporter NarK